MRYKSIFIPIFLILLGCLTLRAGGISNVIVQQQDDVYKFIPTKDGSAIDRIEHQNQTVFRSTADNVTATQIAYYNDDVKINKVSGGTAVYDESIGDDVFYSDAKECRIKVPIKKNGNTAKVSFTATYSKPEFFAGKLLLDSYDIELWNITFEIPTSFASRYSVTERNIPDGLLETSRETKGDMTQIRYTIRNLKSPTLYSDAPSPLITEPRLILMGHFSDADELYRYLYSYLPDSDPGADVIEAKARELTADCTTDAERITAINDFVHSSIRYVAMEHGEFSHRPDYPSEVLRKRYGDCKCSAGLIRALLRAVGIDARYAWIGTSKHIGIDWSDVPSISSGDHMIAAVILPDSILFLDGTASHNPVGVVPSGIQGCQAMIEDTSERPILARVPVDPLEKNVKRHICDASFISDNELAIKGSITFNGTRCATFNSMTSYIHPGKRNDAYLNILGELIKGHRATSASVESGLFVSTLSGEGTAVGLITNSGSDTYVDFNPMPGLNDYKFETKDRTSDGWCGRASTDITANLHLPEGYVSGELPRDVTVDNDWLSASVINSLSPDGRTVTRHVTFNIKTNTIPCASLTDFNADIQRLQRACNTKLVLKRQS